MNQSLLLKETVAAFFKVAPEEVNADFRLNGERLRNSITQASLDAKLRRHVGVRTKAIYTAKTFGELEAAINGTNAVVASDLPATKPSAATNKSLDSRFDSSVNGREATTQNRDATHTLACGVDIELLENLPLADDYWEHEFYRGMFTAQEIAYCLLRDAPREHFAGIWCAKEALKKCDSSFLHEEMNRIEVTNDNAGAPLLYHLQDGAGVVPQALPVAVSISHTSLVAMAMVTKLNEVVQVNDKNFNDKLQNRTSESQAVMPSLTAMTPDVKNGAEKNSSIKQPESTGVSFAALSAWLFSFLALVVACLALARTFG